MISPACRQVIFFVTARKFSSCIFIARSAAAPRVGLQASLRGW